ncbi:hypothetical protein HYH03_004362 [Edaphochlamys debaryana]|uniref:Uncharacterized protein n=1 Tax=Edaphochlamys debaryana TaxID=47281 RepID=A0A836C244_9CHLO|nr:hypothetical protein HYH03_004362 [Edaphochlamys debaryana]|eukprot:KAG2497621.1 hypothetical protein HYH03_004362 [Edaphochlamys debaryana]
MASSSGSTALETVLRQLGVEGADKMVDSMLPGPSNLSRDTNLSDARLACRAVRSFLDSGVRKLRLAVSFHSTPGEVPRLERFERVKCLELLLNPDFNMESDDESPDVREQLMSLMLLPLALQPPETLRRITSLAVRWEPDEMVTGGLRPSLYMSVPPLGISSLAQYLPSLTDLNLDVPIGTVYSYNWHLMYDKLAASLPYLEGLRLTSCDALQGIGALAPSLKRLKLSPVYMSSSMDVPHEAIAHIAQLTSLTHLSFQSSSFEPATLRDLLDTLPDGKPEFRMALHDASSSGCRWDAGFRDGLLRELCIQGHMDDLAAACRHVILPSRSLDFRLERIRLGQVAVLAEPLSQEEVAPLQALLGRCNKVELGTLALYDSPAWAPVAQALALFGPPQEVLWSVRFGTWSSVRFPAPPPDPLPSASTVAAASPAEGPAAAATAAAAAPPPPLPPPAEALQRAVDLLAAANAGTPIAAPPSTQLSCNLLVRGPGVRVLLQAPGGVMDWLNEAARHHAPAGSPADFQAVGALRLLPSASAVLLTNSDAPGALEALSAAAAAAAAAHMGMLQLVSLGELIVGTDPARALSQALSQAVEEVLTARAAHGPAALLEWVVGFTAFLKAQPEPHGVTMPV